ncbi:MAG: hypothetical protein QI199_02460 [Candidatus Korarchaeota archaeon]|nr:hypothetical protein [Candidatus Korarchaeota archaeon]
MPSLRDFLAYGAGAILIFFGLVFLIASSYNPSRVLPGFTMLLLGGAAIYANMMVKRAQVSEELLEARVIRLARRKGGYVTVADVAADLNLPVDTAKQVLERLERRGLAFLDFKRIGDEGVEVYRILGTSSSDEES